MQSLFLLSSPVHLWWKFCVSLRTKSALLTCGEESCSVFELEIKSVPSPNLKARVASGGKEEIRPHFWFQVFTETYCKLINVKNKCYFSALKLMEVWLCPSDSFAGEELDILRVLKSKGWIFPVGRKLFWYGNFQQMEKSNKSFGIFLQVVYSSHTQVAYNLLSPNRTWLAGEAETHAERGPSAQS